MIEIINLNKIPKFIDPDKLKKVVLLIHGNVNPIIKSVNAEVPLPNVLNEENKIFEQKFSQIADLSSDFIAQSKVYFEAQLQYVIVVYGKFSLYKRETKYVKKYIKKLIDEECIDEIDYFLHMIMSKCDLLETAKTRYEIMITACHTELVSRKSNVERSI